MNVSLIAPILSFVVAFLLYRFPFAAAASTAVGNELYGWASSFHYYAYFPLLAGGIVWAVWAMRKCTSYVVLRPLVWLPAILLGSYLGEWIGLRLAGLILPLGTAAVAALCLSRILERPEIDASPRRQTAWFTLLSALLILVFCFILFPHTSGGGDVQHYAIQTQSLLRYHTLNLRQICPEIAAEFDAMPPEVAAQSCPGHIRSNYRGELYSYHSFGYSLLSYPFEALMGEFGQKLLRFLIALFAALGCRAACLRTHVRPRYATIGSLLLALSAPWLLYSIAYLPEGIGCALTAWAFWAIQSQKDPTKRVLATATCAIAAATLPFFHIRFLPLAGILAACFGLEGLCFLSSERWGRKLLRLALFSLVCVLGWGLVYGCQQRMFSYPIDGQAVGAAYNYKRVLWGCPLTMWGMLANKVGLGAVLPFLYWLLPATLVTPFVYREKRREALYALITTATILVTCNTTSAALEGACVPGRYLLQSVPLLLPFGLLLLQDAQRPARLWALFLGAFAVLVSFFVLPYVPSGKLVHIVDGIRSLGIPLSTYWNPFPDYVVAPYQHYFVAGSAFVGCLFLASLLFQVRRTVLALLVLVAAFGMGVASQCLQDRWNPLDNAFVFTYHPTWTRYKAVNRSHATNAFDFFILPYSPREDYLVFSPKEEPTTPEWMPTRHPGGISHNFDGTCAVRLRGDTTEDTAVRFDVWQGSHERWVGEVLPSGAFDVSLLVPTKKGWGDTYVRMSLPNKVGSVRITGSDVLPFTPAMLEVLPPIPESVQFTRIEEQR